MDNSIEKRLNEFSAYQAALTDQHGHKSHLAQVLITAAYLDNQLKIILEAFMVVGRSHSALFEGPNAPIGSFSSRVSVSYSLGLIEELERTCLTAIRQIRNDFAHDLKASFNSDKHTKNFDRIAKLIGEEAAGDRDRSQLLFIAGVNIGFRLLNRADHVAAEARTGKGWPRERIDFDPNIDPLDLIY